MRAEALKGHLDGLLLAALEPGPAHGFAVMAELRRRTGGTVDLESGTLYPALRRLEEAGLIAGTWTTVAGQPGMTGTEPGGAIDGYLARLGGLPGGYLLVRGLAPPRGR